ncbi:MAG: nicotinate phosphoribosyltransferase [Dehalococcoidia bacterium]|nr:nicotinate phosphoribosyltransferase [Dehalococcoidia bacterium]
MNMPQPEEMCLLTDLYELTMAQSYFEEGHNEQATFSLFIRKYPPHRGFFVSCGLEDVLRYLESFRFSTGAVDRLYRAGIFSDRFLEYLKGLRFTGEVRAIPEGRLFFVNQPVLEVTAPIIEAQIIETFIINQVNLQSLIATKAARCVHAARGRRMVDFSLRRTQGIDAGMKVARASYIAGFASTSNVLAGATYGIPLAGTMAHSYISSYEHEIDAFRAFVRGFSERSILLIDTYDTVAGAQKAVEVAREMAARGQHLRGVRIDSGDLAALGFEVRRILDAAGFHEAQIVGSGGLDEFDLEELSQVGAPYDAYGVGTRMGVSGDAPWTDMAYKLVRYNGRPVLKLSSGKVSLPDAKQVFRFSEAGRMHHDVIALHQEETEGGEPLLERVMADGQILGRLPRLAEIRERFLDEFGRLDDRYKTIRDPAAYPVEVSAKLQSLTEELRHQVAAEELEPVRQDRELGES